MFTRRSPLIVVGTGLAFVVSVFFVSPGAQAAQAPVGLGTASSFAILAGSGITNTGPTTVTGDIGTFPTTSETGFGSITQTGTNHAGDATTQGAKGDLVTAYNDAAGRTPVTNVAVELGGTTLNGGVYTSPTLGLTGTLTLDGQGDSSSVFVFQAGSTITTASNSRILLIHGAQACNVVWQIGSSATFNTGTSFVGDVLAHTSITAQTGATFQGRLLARDGAVTLDTNTITRSTCAAPTVPTTTALTTSPTTTSTAGTPVTLTATVTAGSGTPTGTATFSDAGAVVGSAPLVNGQAALTIANPTVGAHTFGVEYVAGPGFTSSGASSLVQYSVTSAAAGATPAVAQTPQVAQAPELPFTGDSTWALLAVGTGLIAVGTVALLGAGTRRIKPSGAHALPGLIRYRRRIRAE